MDWDTNFKTTSVPRPESSFGFIYNYNFNHPHQGMEFKHHLAMAAAAPPPELPHMAAAVPAAQAERNMLSNYGNFHQEKKKRLSNEQLESLERSFQEEVKLDPDRKMKLSKELGLQPRQIAVWFQNRRARWKTKQLESLYGALKMEYDLITREKMKLQEEVKILRSILREEAAKKQISTGCTDISAEETVESTSIAAQSSGKPQGRNHHPVAETSYLFHVDDYTTAPPPYWAI